MSRKYIIVLMFSMSLSFMCIPDSVGKDISIIIPRETLAQLINDTLPVQVVIKEKGFSGDMWIESIDDLVLGNNEVSFSSDVWGKDIRFSRKIHNQPVDVSLGNIRMFLKCSGTLRYDKKKHTLFLAPQIKKETDKNKSGGIITGISPLMAVLSGREYAVQIQEIKPITTKFGNKSLKINMVISDIHTKDNILYVDVEPSIEAYKE